MNRTWTLNPTALTVLAIVTLASTAQAGTLIPTFQKAFEPATIGPGSISTLVFTISNPDPLPVRNLAFTDNLPAGVIIATPGSPTSTCMGTLSAPDGGAAITLNDGAVGGSSSCSISVQVTSGAAGTHNNVSGDLTSDAGNSGPAAADLTVATDRPSFSKSFDPDSVSLGGRSTLTFTIDNSANSSNAVNLSFMDNLPTGIEIADPANAFTDCGGGVITASPGGSIVSYGPAFAGDASVAAGASCSVSVRVVGTAAGALVNTSGELTSIVGVSTRSSGIASATLTVSVDPIAFFKTFLDDPAAPGDTVNLQFTIRNLNRSSSAVDIAFTDDLDATLSGLAATGPVSDPCGPGSSLTGADLLTLTGGNLGPGATCTFSVVLQVPNDAGSGAFSNTTSQISAEVDGSPVTGSPASDQLFITPAPRLTKTFLDDPVGAGGSVVLEFTITNTSPSSSATDIAFVDVFDIILPTASATPADGFCGAGSMADFTPLSGPVPAQLEIFGASLGPGESCTFSITLDIIVGAGGGFYFNTTSAVTATVDNESVTGRPASDDLEVVSAPLLRKEFTDDPVVAGGTATLEFTLTHAENAPGDATGIAFSDDLTAALSGLAAIGLPLADVCGTGSEISGATNLQFSGGTLAPGETCTFSVTLQTPSGAAPGPYTNTTSNVVATVIGEPAVHIPASDDLQIAGLTLTKEFIDDPARPGGTVTLRFTITNLTADSTATGIFFTDDLDDTLPGLAATGLPMNDVCGGGSSLIATAADTFLTFQNGTLGPGASCSFDVALEVPVSTDAATYLNSTSEISATFDGATISFDNASDRLTIVTDFLELTKEFTDDPVGPGENVNLRFTLTNLDAALTASEIAFTDDLDAALTGLASVSGALNDVCGAGSQITGTGFLSFSGGTLPPGGSCTFDVTLLVPATVALGTRATNQTSQATGMLEGLAVTGDAAVDDLQIDFLTFAKAFDGDATAGGTVGLSFTIQNLDSSNAISELSFQDDLDNVISGLTAIGLPENDVCGSGSVLDGTSLLTLMGGNLLPGGSCTFSVDLQVPPSASPGDYVNTTSDLLQFGFPVANPASDVLTVLGVQDEDGDGVADDDDLCPGTVIPEGVPTVELGVNRFALVDNDGIFDTVPPKGKGPQAFFTIVDTAGCSCEQIIVEQNLGEGHVKFGCSLGAMRNWVDLVSP